MRLQSEDTPPRAVTASKEGQGSYALRLARGDQLTAEEWNHLQESIKFVRALRVRIEYKWPWRAGAEYLYRALIRALGLEHREEELLRLAKSKPGCKEQRELAARMSVLGVEITKRHGAKMISCSPENNAKVVRAIYQELVPKIDEARKLIRGKEGKITIPELQKAFRETTLAMLAAQEDWKTMIEEFGNPKGRVMYAKGIARAIIRRTMALADGTIKTYVKLALKP